MGEPTTVTESGEMAMMAENHHSTWSRRARAQGDDGAALVEFALVMPLLFLLLFGIVEFGINMNDYQSIRQGVARCRPSGRGGRLRDRDLRPGVQHAAEQLRGGAVHRQVKALRAQQPRGEGRRSPTTTATRTTSRADKVKVCAVSKAKSVTGILAPFLKNVYMKSSVEMRAEKNLTLANAPRRPIRAERTGHGAEPARSTGLGRQRCLADPRRALHGRRSSGSPRSWSTSATPVRSDVRCRAGSTPRRSPARRTCRSPANNAATRLTKQSQARKTAADYAARNLVGPERGWPRLHDPDRLHLHRHGRRCGPHHHHALEPATNSLPADTNSSNYLGYIYVQACENTATFFARVVQQSSPRVCRSAVGRYTATGGGFDYGLVATDPTKCAALPSRATARPSSPPTAR